MASYSTSNEMSKNIFAIDTETTGFSGTIMPVSIGIKEVYGSFEYYQTINPEKKIEGGAKKIHGISSKEIAASPLFNSVWKDIERAIGGYQNAILIAHNAGYDFSRILRKLVSGFNEYEQYCSLALARGMLGYDEVEDHKLATIYRHLSGYEFLQHNALEDAKAVAYIVEEMHARSDYLDEEIVPFLTENAGPGKNMKGGFSSAPMWHGDAPPVEITLPKKAETFSFTGKFYVKEKQIPRDLVAEQIQEKYQLRKVNSVSQSDVLFVGNTQPHTPSKKEKEAEKLGVKVIDASEIKFIE